MPAADDSVVVRVDDLHALHRQIDALLSEVQRLVATGPFDAAATRCAELARLLDRHMQAEEEPDAREVARSSGATRAEHAEMRRLVGDLANALGRHDRRAVGVAVDALEALLDIHELKQERLAR